MENIGQTVEGGVLSIHFASGHRHTHMMIGARIVAACLIIQITKPVSEVVCLPVGQVVEQVAKFDNAPW